jgi:chromosome segregation ATPase
MQAFRKWGVSPGLSDPRSSLASMDPEAIKRAQARIDQAASGRMEPAQLDAALERAREQVEALAATAAELESTLPGRVGDALQDGLREQVRPVGRNLAEIRGLMNQLIRRLERVEGDLLAERHARVDDLALLVDLVSSGWRGVEQRLARIEARITADDAVVYRIDRQAS